MSTVHPPRRWGVLAGFAATLLVCLGTGLVLSSHGGDAVPLQGPTAPSLVAAGAAFDPHDNALLVFGGYIPSTGVITAETWTWRGVRWERRTLPPDPALTPPPREAPALVYDPGRQALLLTGGFGPGGAGPLSDLWSWDGDWHRVPDSSSAPAPALLPSMAWSAPDHAPLYVCQCRAAQGSEVETWRLDPVQGWRRQHPAHEPVLHSSALLASAAGSVSTLLVADAADAAARGATWIWDGRDWTPGPLTPPGFDPLSAQLAADPTGGGTLLVQEGSTWQWDGTAWHPVATGTPPPRHGALVSLGGPLQLLAGAAAESPETVPWTGSQWTRTTPRFVLPEPLSRLFLHAPGGLPPPP